MRRSRPMPPRRPPSVTIAATSCPRSWRPGKAARAGCGAARQRLERERAERAKPVPRSRPDRLREAKRRLEEEHAVERDAHEQYEAYRARGVMRDGRRFGRPPNARRASATPDGRVNLTDFDSKLVHGMKGWIQGYNAQ